MVSNDFVSANHILAEITSTVDDKAFRNGFPKGWFMSRIQDAMQELAVDTMYFKLQHDEEIPASLQVKIPENVFNIREIYLYNGSFCNPIKTQNVYYKRLFNNNYDGQGYTAMIKDDGSNSGDPFVGDLSRNSITSPYNLYDYYANEQNGILMLSRSSIGYKYIRIIFNGFGTAVGDIPIIPRMFEEAIKDFVYVRYYNAMKSRDPRKYRPLWIDAKNDLENPQTGSWNKARKRANSMNTYERESMNLYIGSLIHK
jgi:hypothetical protein